MSAYDGCSISINFQNPYEMTPHKIKDTKKGTKPFNIPLMVIFLQKIPKKSKIKNPNPARIIMGKIHERDRIGFLQKGNLHTPNLFLS